jgi:hypothetical protein
MSVAALAAFVTYRRTSAPATALVGLGAACVAVNFVMFDLIWRKASGHLRLISPGYAKGAEVMCASLVSWLLFAVCLLFAIRWMDEERRVGRARFVGFALGIVAILALSDLVIFYGREFGRPGAGEDALAWLALATTALASVRASHVPGESTGWLAMAAAIAVGAPGAWLLAGTGGDAAGDVAVAWYLTVPFVVGTLIVFACLAAARPVTR